MRISELQSKDVVNTLDGKNVGRIIDIDISDSGVINSFIVEPKKYLKRMSIYNNEILIKYADIVKIGKDVILVNFQ